MKNENYPLYPVEDIGNLKELLSYAAEKYGDNTAFSFERKKDVINICKIVISCLMMAAVVWGIYALINPYFLDDFIGKLLVLAIPVIGGVIVYMLVCALLKVEELNMLLGFFKKKERGESA